MSWSQNKFIEPNRVGHFTFPDHNDAPAEFFYRPLMQFIPRRIAIEFRQPEFLPMRGRGAICGLVALYTQRYCCFMPFDFQKFIERNPQVCAGEAVIRGTRVTVRTILASLAESASVEEIVADFPTVSRDAVRAIIAYAAASAEEDIPVSPLPSLA